MFRLCSAPDSVLGFPTGMNPVGFDDRIHHRAGGKTDAAHPTGHPTGCHPAPAAYLGEKENAGGPPQNMASKGGGVATRRRAMQML